MATVKTLGSALLLCAVCITVSEAYWCSSLNCPFSCCGSYPNEWCCSEIDSSFTTTLSIAARGGIIAGAVIGGIIFISIVVAVIIICLKNQSYAGRVVQPAMTTRANNIAVLSTGTSSQYPGAYPMGPVTVGATPMGPPPYKGFENPPPAYPYTSLPGAVYSNPAYPPTYAAASTTTNASSNPAYPPSYAPASTTTNASFKPAYPPSSAATVTPSNDSTSAPPPGFNVNGPSTSAATQ